MTGLIVVAASTSNDLDPGKGTESTLQGSFERQTPCPSNDLDSGEGTESQPERVYPADLLALISTRVRVLKEWHKYLYLWGLDLSTDLDPGEGTESASGAGQTSELYQPCNDLDPGEGTERTITSSRIDAHRLLAMISTWVRVLKGRDHMI